MWRKIARRLVEPSSMAGLSALALVFGMPSEMVTELGKIASGLLGLAAILLPEKS